MSSRSGCRTRSSSTLASRGAQVFRLYGRLRDSAAGLRVPLIFTNHTGAELGSQTATVPDYYLGPDVSIGDVEQLLITFLPESAPATPRP